MTFRVNECRQDGHVALTNAATQMCVYLNVAPPLPPFMRRHFSGHAKVVTSINLIFIVTLDTELSNMAGDVISVENVLSVV